MIFVLLNAQIQCSTSRMCFPLCVWSWPVVSRFAPELQTELCFALLGKIWQLDISVLSMGM